MTMLLRVTNLTKRFGGLTAVEKASLDVRAGQVVGVVGENGAGKSTLVKMISGVVTPDEGEMLLNDRRIHRHGPAATRALGIETVYQDLALAGHLDVCSNIFLGREITRSHWCGFVRTLDRRQMREQAIQVLKRLELGVPLLSQPVAQLTAEQRQTVAIARAFACNAKLIVMDEPTAILVPAERHKVLQWVRELGAQGVSVIFVSHSVPEVFTVAERIVVMRRGKKVGELQTAKSTPEQVQSLIVGA